MNVGRIEELAGLQMRLIANAARQLRAGGLLIYSVCSTEPEEGEEVVAWFRQNNPEFRDMTRERLLEIGLDPAPLLDAVIRRSDLHAPSRIGKLFLLRLVEKKMNYTPKPGLNVPVITVLDDSGKLIAEEQRRVLRHVIQNGYGADVIFGVGTTGEWNRIANTERQRIMEVEIDELRKINSELRDCNRQSAIR